MQAQHSLTPDKPFFVYFAPGATHAPHHVPKAYIDRYKGEFNQGWDELRKETFARQKKMGVIPKSAELTQRPSQIPSWDSQSAAAAEGGGASDGNVRRVCRTHRRTRSAD